MGRFVLMAVLVFVACSLAGRGASERLRYILEVRNSYFDIVTIKELPYGVNRFSVYPGETRTLRLTYSNSGKQLEVRSLGGEAHLSSVFYPSETFPCWLLLLDKPLNLAVPVGPVPVECEGGD